MRDVVERVARALCGTDHFPPNCGWTTSEIAEFVDDHWRENERDARAAIAAIREPTEAIVDAAWPLVGSGTEAEAREVVTAVWIAMIDQALKP